MRIGFRVFKDGLDIFTHYKQTYFICTHLYFSIRDEMFYLRIKFHPGGSMTPRSVQKIASDDSSDISSIETNNSSFQSVSKMGKLQG